MFKQVNKNKPLRMRMSCDHVHACEGNEFKLKILTDFLLCETSKVYFKIIMHSLCSQSEIFDF